MFLDLGAYYYKFCISKSHIWYPLVMPVIISMSNICMLSGINGIYVLNIAYVSLVWELVVYQHLVGNQI